MSSSTHHYPTRLSNNSIPRVKYYPEKPRTPFIRKPTPPTLSIPSPVTSNETTPSNSTTSSPISSKSSYTGITKAFTTHYVSISNTTPPKSLSSRNEYDNNFPEISPLSTSSKASPADPKHFNSSKITKVNNPTYSQITASNLQYQPFSTWDQFLAMPSKPNLSNEAHYNQLYLLLKTKIKTIYTSPNTNSSCTSQRIQTKSSTQSGSSQQSDIVHSQLKKIPTENNIEDQCREPDCTDDSTSSLTSIAFSNTVSIANTQTEPQKLSGHQQSDIVNSQLKKIPTENNIEDHCRAPDCTDDSTSSLTSIAISNTVSFDNTQTEPQTLSRSSKHLDIAQSFTQLKKISTEYNVDDQCRDSTESNTENTNTSLSFTIFSKAAIEIPPLVHKYNTLSKENDYEIPEHLKEQVVLPLIQQLFCIIESVVTHFIEYYQSMHMDNYSDYHYPSPNFQHFYDTIFTEHIKVIISNHLLPQQFRKILTDTAFSLSNPKAIPQWPKHFYEWQLRNLPQIHVLDILYFYDYFLFICQPAIPSCLPSTPPILKRFHKQLLIHSQYIQNFKSTFDQVIANSLQGSNTRDLCLSSQKDI